MNTEKVLRNWIFAFIIITIIFGYTFYISVFQTRQDIDKLNRNFKLYYKEIYGKDYNRDGTPDGIFKGDHFTVWLPGNDYSRVMEICNHEWMHYKSRNGHFD